MVTLGGLAAKNAILIVEFAKTKYEEWMGLVEAALEGAKLRFRPILVIGGILAATFIAVFLIPVLFYFVEKFIGKKKKRRRSSQNPRPSSSRIRHHPEPADREGPRGWNGRARRGKRGVQS